MTSPSRTIADELELASHDLDELIGRIRAGGRRCPTHDDVEEVVQGIARRMMISVRGTATAIGGVS